MVGSEFCDKLASVDIVCSWWQRKEALQTQGHNVVRSLWWQTQLVAMTNQLRLLSKCHVSTVDW